MRKFAFCLFALITAFFPPLAWCVENTDTLTPAAQFYFVGGGISSLSGAVFAIRDGKVPGKNIHIFETKKMLGGALDGAGSPETGYVVRGARKYDNTSYSYGCLWDLMKTIPGMNDPNKTLYDEFVEWNKLYVKDFKGRHMDKDKNVDYATETGLSWRDRKDIFRLLKTPESEIENRTIDSWFQPSFFRTNLWFNFCSMFGFSPYHDLVECKRYLLRFGHGVPHMIGGSPQHLEVAHPINQYESLILPIQKWLADKGVDFMLGCRVTDLDFAPGDEITVNRIHYVQDGEAKEIAVNKGEYVFVTNGSNVADTTRGASKSPAPRREEGKLDGSWSLWENIAKKKPGRLGNPSVFDSHLDKTTWVLCTITSSDSTFFDLFEKKTGNKPGFSDLVTFKDSPWLFHVQVPAQPHFLNQPENVKVWIVYALNSTVEGQYVKKKMTECSGDEILTEVCHQFGFEKDLPHILATSISIPTLEPYASSLFMPRQKSDRPAVVPEGSTNLAFMGQYVESGECVFLVEQSVRTAQIGVYRFLNIDRKVHPVFVGADDGTFVEKMSALYTLLFK